MMDFVASCYNEHAVKVSQAASCSGSGASASAIINSSSGTGGVGLQYLYTPVQSTVTCFYRTRLSSSSNHKNKELLIKVTWSKSLVGGQPGLSISIDDIPLVSSSNSPPSSSSSNHHPLLQLRKKKGSRSYVYGGSVVGLYWDISSARYDSGPGPEPVEGFYVVVIMDEEIVLFLGDMSSRLILTDPPPPPSSSSSSTTTTNNNVDNSRSILDEHINRRAEFSLVGRREQVVGNSLVHCTKARFGNDGTRDHEIYIRCKGGEGRDPAVGGGGGKESELLVFIDKKKVVHVRRLRWNFRGNQIIFVDGLPVDMMWDVHNWYWPCSGNSRSGGGKSRNAVFMFRARSSLESSLWLEEEEDNDQHYLLHQNHHHQQQQFNSDSISNRFSLLIHAFKTPL